jgi:hypothetical protein
LEVRQHAGDDEALQTPVCLQVSSADEQAGRQRGDPWQRDSQVFSI